MTTGTARRTGSRASRSCPRSGSRAASDPGSLRLLAFALLALAQACDPGFDEPAFVKDLRVLAIAADSPEFLDLDSPRTEWKVRLTALIADPAGAGRPISCRLQSCVLSQNQRCEDPATTLKLAEGPCTDGENPFDVTLPRDLVEKALAKDTFKGFNGVAVWIEWIVTAGSEEVHAVKSVVFAVADPPGRTANVNPGVAGLDVDGKAGLAAGFEFDAGAKVRLELKAAADAKQQYVLRTFEGGTTDQEEYLRYAYYTDAGSLSRDHTSDKPPIFTPEDPKPPELWSDWTAPEKDVPASVRFWFVLTDGRGGVSWTTGKAAPRVP
jgi:hypothetical protein